MGKIKLQQVGPDEIQVSIPSNTPLGMVEELTKSLNSKGLFEDLNKSTLSTRYFSNIIDRSNRINDLADKLIKSLEQINKDDGELPYWHPKAKEEHKRKLRAMDAKSPNVSTNSTQSNISPTNPTNTLHPTDANAQWTAGGSGKRYAFIKNENEKDSKNKKNKDLNKSWAQHKPIPSAEEEIMRLAAMDNVPRGEDAIANQLAHMMSSRSMLNGHNQPSSEELIMHGETMGLGVSEKVAKAADQQWNGTINNWLIEASKPISQRFASEEEELQYWKNIPVSDGDNGSDNF